MLKDAPQNTIKEEVVEEKAMVVAQGQGLAAMPTGEVLQPESSSFHCVISPETIAKASAFMGTTVGPAIGGVVGNAMGYELGEKVATKVRETVKEQGDKIVGQILQGTGMDGIPGAEKLIQANVTGMAHQAGEMAYQETVKVMTTKGAMIGAVSASAGTVAALESVNLIGYLYNQYVSPYLTSYSQARAQARAAEQDRQALAIQELEQDWVLVEADEKEPNISPANRLEI